MTWNTLSKAFKAQMIIRKVNQLSLYFDGILVLPELLPLAWHGEKATYLPAADFATCFVRFKVTWITTITSASAAALQTRVKPHLWGLGRVGNLVGPRVTKLLFVGFADVRNPRRRRARQRRTSSPFAVCGFFSPDNTRYEEAVPFCGSSAPSTTSRPALPQRGLESESYQTWIPIVSKVDKFLN